MRRALILGEAPLIGTDLARPLLGRTGERVYHLLTGARGLPFGWYEQLSSCFDLATLFPAPVETWSIAAARDAARGWRAVAGMDHWSVVIALGRRVAAALEIDGDFFHTVRYEAFAGAIPAYAVVVPHPSGRSRWWNEQANVARAEEFWFRVARKLSAPGVAPTRAVSAAPRLARMAVAR